MVGFGGRVEDKVEISLFEKGDVSAPLFKCVFFFYHLDTLEEIQWPQCSATTLKQEP